LACTSGNPATFRRPGRSRKLAECFIVRDANGQAFGNFYFDDEAHRRSMNKRLTKDEARHGGQFRPAASIAEKDFTTA
jgi:hypothetical protein